MKSRHRAREIALQILYQYDLNSHNPGPVVAIEPQKPKLIADLTHHFSHFNTPEPLREFVGQLVIGTLHELKKLDEIIEKSASNWKISRMSAVDRSLLRMSTYEMLFINEVPSSVVIDEAIELAKGFGTSETPAFINGILDNIKTASPTESKPEQTD